MRFYIISFMKLLITGGSGFIGTAAMQWALDKEYNVINYDLIHLGSIYFSLFINLVLIIKIIKYKKFIYL